MKVNSEGRACPEWCAIDHQAENARRDCTTRSPWLGKGRTCWADTELDTYPDSAARVVVGARNDALPSEKEYGVQWADTSGGARRMADFLDCLSASTPATIRGLAAQVREASALAWPEKEIEAG